MNRKMTDIMSRVTDIINVLEDPQRLAALQAEARRKAMERIARNNARFEAWLGLMTDAQKDRVIELEASGAKINKVYKRNGVARVAVMMVKRGVWNDAKGAPGTKLMMVYGDGTTNQTFEKSISIRKEF